MVKLIDLARKQTRTLFEDTELLVIRGLREQLDPESTHVSTKKSEENADKSEVLLTFAGAEIQDEIFKWTTVTAEIHTKEGYSHANTFADALESIVELLPKKVGPIAYVEIVNSWTRKENGDLQGLEVRELTFDVMIRGKRDSGEKEEPLPHWTEIFDEGNPYITPRIREGGYFENIYEAQYDPPLSSPVNRLWAVRSAQLVRPDYAVGSVFDDPYRYEDLYVEQKGLDGVFSSYMDSKWNQYTGNIGFSLVYPEYVFDKNGDWDTPRTGYGDRIIYEESKTFTPIVVGVRGGSTEIVYTLEGGTRMNTFNFKQSMLTASNSSSMNMIREVKGIRFYHPDHKDSDPTPPLIPWEEYKQSVSTVSVQSAAATMSIQSEEPDYPGEEEEPGDGERMAFIKY